MESFGSSTVEHTDGVVGDDAARRNAYRLQSVDRALDVLDLLADAGPDGMALAEVASALGTSKSTAFAVLQTLGAREFVTDSGSRRSRRYRLGLALARLGEAALSQISLVDIATPSLRELTSETGWTSRVGVLQDGYAVIVGLIEGQGTVRFRSNLARRELPHSTAIGKAILAHMDEDAAREILERTGLPARTPKTITSVDKLVRDLHKTHARGYALDDEEDNLGVFCIGAPVFDHTGACVAAVSVTGLKPAVQASGVAELAATVGRYADDISSKLGMPTSARSTLTTR